MFHEDNCILSHWPITISTLSQQVELWDGSSRESTRSHLQIVNDTQTDDSPINQSLQKPTVPIFQSVNGMILSKSLCELQPLPCWTLSPLFPMVPCGSSWLPPLVECGWYTEEHWLPLECFSVSLLSFRRSFCCGSVWGFLLLCRCASYCRLSVSVCISFLCSRPM